MRGGLMQERYPVSATTGISFDDYAKMRVARHAMRQAKTVPEFAANDSMFRRVILQKCWQYCRRVPMPEGTKLSDIDAVATKKALNAGFGFEATSPNHQDRVMRHAEVIRRCGGYASFCSAIAYRAWRMRWDSTYIAEEMQLEPEHVRQTLSRLVAIADALGYPTFEKRHHSKGVPKNFKGVARDGRVYGRPKPEPTKKERVAKPPVYLVGPQLQTAITMRVEGKTLAEIAAATGASMSKISTVLNRMGLGHKKFNLDVAAYNALRAEGKTVKDIATAWGIRITTLNMAVHKHRKRHGADSIPMVYNPKHVDVERAKALKAEGKTYTEIGKVFGIHRATVIYAMRKAGFRGRFKLKVEQAVALAEQGKTVREIAEVFGVSRRVVVYVLKKAGAYIPVRVGRPRRAAKQ